MGARAAWWDRAYGLARSLVTYYGKPGKARLTDRFYRGFVNDGDLCFDIGAHVGDRSRAWRRLGARVVAIEPQPDLARLLRFLFRRDRSVTVLEQAIGACPGSVTLHVSPRTPTVTTGSSRFIAETRRIASFAWVAWSERIEVPLTTLDRLIASHGSPAFVKIDVEGMEHEVLAGLSRPLPCLSFEFVPSSLASAEASLDRLSELGRYEHNVALGEAMRLLWPSWVGPEAMRDWLRRRPPEGPSGDIYARLVGEPEQIEVTDGQG